MASIPKFNLNADSLDITSDADLASAIEKEGRKGFDPGNVKLKIAKPRYHANKTTGEITCAKDPTWFNVAVSLQSADGRSKDYFVQVPTSKVKYGNGEKSTLFVFKKFVEFMSGIGEAVSLNNLGKLCEKYFGSEDALKALEGKELDVDLGYDGPHAEKSGDQYKIVLKTGDYQEDGETVLFPDFASAKVFANAKGIELSRVEVLKINTAIKAVKTEGWD